MAESVEPEQDNTCGGNKSAFSGGDPSACLRAHLNHQ